MNDTNSGAVRAAVVGVGAIGGLLAAALSRAGVAVSAYARGATLDALNAHGVRVIDDAGATSTVAVHASDDAAALGVQDYVVIALKAQALPALAARIAPLVGPDTVIVAAMNGLPWWFTHGLAGPFDGVPLEAVDPAGAVSAALPPAQAIGCVVHLSSSTDAPGVVRRGRGNRLIVGAPDGRLEAAAARFAALLSAGGFDVESTPAIRTEIWAKLWGNMNMNPLSALTGSTAEQLLDDSFTHDLALRMMEEAAQIGAKLGLSTGMSGPERIAVTRKLGAFKTSMLQDFEAGRPLEIGPILGVFPELGRRLNVPTPYCDAVLGLLRQRAANSGL
ncbi:2-dehydropantoate 2-reductase [Burkholderia multivorans]|uniref:2-dehydropantoate 2-reductase n=1 Tax=Burkholderia multivorans TaxID=87883 RepID=UPI000D3C81F9|nr:2-dehydropantoate 2-reductase [Burkholderia multivorans]MBR8018249.1 2-dehydropantoate 2-reductase [Burkholderia multivorans]MEB2510935.1 2-dehydropantoate 2-reductase [Burkholderia multivorans]MEB2522565.1 2-dehydropantoate 2-reductase [Burkholderia multivorans]MEB2573349.1 2-dehydropantoate 2-reductase [Burkholderia multivorans]MEB2595042.1 2-dehydropantoate 2-reductase [Burkholderia multivorans]